MGDETETGRAPATLVKGGEARGQEEQKPVGQPVAHKKLRGTGIIRAAERTDAESQKSHTLLTTHGKGNGEENDRKKIARGGTIPKGGVAEGQDLQSPFRSVQQSRCDQEIGNQRSPVGEDGSTSPKNRERRGGWRHSSKVKKRGEKKGREVGPPLKKLGKQGQKCRLLGRRRRRGRAILDTITCQNSTL